MPICHCVQQPHVGADPGAGTHPHAWPLVWIPHAGDVNSTQQPCQLPVGLLALLEPAGCHSSSGAEVSLMEWAGQFDDWHAGVPDTGQTTAGSVEQRKKRLGGSMVQLWLDDGGGGGGPRRGPWAAACSASQGGFASHGVPSTAGCSANRRGQQGLRLGGCSGVWREVQSGGVGGSGCSG